MTCKYNPLVAFQTKVVGLRTGVLFGHGVEETLEVADILLEWLRLGGGQSASALDQAKQILRSSVGKPAAVTPGNGEKEAPAASDPGDAMVEGLPADNPGAEEAAKEDAEEGEGDEGNSAAEAGPQEAPEEEANSTEEKADAE